MRMTNFSSVLTGYKTEILYLVTNQHI